MLTLHDIENTRRSAAMAPLSRDETMRLLLDLETLLRERSHIASVLGSMNPSFVSVRKALNELQRVIQN